MDKPKTLEEALQLVPGHVMLRPGVDVWQEGDEQIVLRAGGLSSVTRKSQFGDIVWGHGRRPIPADVREAMAYKILNRNAGGENLRALFDRHNHFEAWLLQNGRNEETKNTCN